MARWIRPDKRKKIYERDNHVCAYCGARVRILNTRECNENELQYAASLDHIVPRNEFVKSNRAIDNSPQNLITSCMSCNSRRHDTPINIFTSRERANEIKLHVRQNKI